MSKGALIVYSDRAHSSSNQSIVTYQCPWRSSYSLLQRTCLQPHCFQSMTNCTAAPYSLVPLLTVFLPPPVLNQVHQGQSLCGWTSSQTFYASHRPCHLGGQSTLLTPSFCNPISSYLYIASATLSLPNTSIYCTCVFTCVIAYTYL